MKNGSCSSLFMPSFGQMLQNHNTGCGESIFGVSQTGLWWATDSKQNAVFGGEGEKHNNMVLSSQKMLEKFWDGYITNCWKVHFGGILFTCMIGAYLYIWSEFQFFFMFKKSFNQIFSRFFFFFFLSDDNIYIVLLVSVQNWCSF